MLDLLDPGRHLDLRPAVDDRRVIRPQTQGGPDRVHRHVPAADHGNILPPHDGGVVFRETIGLHEVGAGEILVRRIDAAQVLAGDVHEDRRAGADPEEDRVEPLREELVYRLEPPDDGVRFDLHAQFLEIVDLRLHDRLRQSKLRYSVNKDAARLVQGLEDRHVITEIDQIARDREPRGTGADHRDLFPVGLCRRGDGDIARLLLVVGGEPLKAADGHGFSLLPEDADLLALVLLRADAAADGGEGVRFLEFERRLDELPFGDQLDESRDIDIDGASGNAAGLLALDAALRLGDCGLLGITRGHFVKVFDPDIGRLLGHLLPGDLFLLRFYFIIFH